MPFRPFPGKPASLFDSGAADGQPEHYLVAHIDGGSRGNPGPAGYGAVLEDETGRRVAELSEFLGRQTNNYAEYAGLLGVLEYALKHGHRALQVISDSELLVKQINGQYKVSNPALQELYARARKLIRQLEHFEIKHVLREKNRGADRLANLAMDRGTGKPAHADQADTREVNGLVRNGIVEFLGTPFPDGTLVKVRLAPPSKR